MGDMWSGTGCLLWDITVLLIVLTFHQWLLLKLSIFIHLLLYHYTIIHHLSTIHSCTYLSFCLRCRYGYFSAWSWYSQIIQCLWALWEHGPEQSIAVPSDMVKAQVTAEYCSAFCYREKKKQRDSQTSICLSENNYNFLTRIMLFLYYIICILY